MGDFIKTLTSLIGSIKAKVDGKIGILQKRIDEIPTETVLYTPQTLTDEQQKQARDNIGADVGGYFEIRVTKSGDTYTADKTYNEIKVAIESGLTPVCRMKRWASDAILDDVFYYYNWQIVNGRPDDNAFIFNNMSISVSRFIAIYNSGIVYYFDAVYNFYTLPTATSTTLGGVRPVAKTAAMTQDVGVDENGKLYTKPAEGGTDLSLGISGAAIGQIAKITAVDTDGKPTAWEPVDMPSGGGGHVFGTYDYSVLASGTIPANTVTEIGLGKSYFDTGVTVGDLRKYRIWGCYYRCDDGKQYYGFAISSGITDRKILYNTNNAMQVIAVWADDAGQAVIPLGTSGNVYCTDPLDAEAIGGLIRQPLISNGGGCGIKAFGAFLGAADSDRVYVGIFHMNGKSTNEKDMRWAITGVVRK